MVYLTKSSVASHLASLKRLWRGNTASLKLDLNAVKLTPVKTAGKGLIVNAKYSEIGGLSEVEGPQEYVFYPSVEHAPHFASTTPFVFGQGPGDQYPGAVGVLRYYRHPMEYSVRYIQGCFKQRTGTLDAKTLRHYADWQKHLLEVVFENARREKTPIVSFETVFPASMPSPRILEQFEKTSGKNNFGVYREEGSMPNDVYSRVVLTAYDKQAEGTAKHVVSLTIDSKERLKELLKWAQELRKGKAMPK